MLLTTPSFWKLNLAKLDLGGLNPAEGRAQVLGLTGVEFREDLGLEVRKNLFPVESPLMAPLCPRKARVYPGRGRKRGLLSPGW